MNYQRWVAVLLFMLAASFAVCAQAQDKRPEYQLGAGDTIRILVYQNPDLTLETRVTENGTITFPLIGSVKIGGLTIALAEKTIANALQAGSFIRQPQVTIVPQQIRSRQVSVLGQVGRPGRFPIETYNTGISEMIAIAGGISPGGSDIVILTGVRDGKPFRREIDVSGIFLNNQMQDDLVVADGDEIYVHRAPMFYIYGEVQRPGSYRVERGMTIRQALAQGGGLTGRGTERNLGLYRRGANGVIKLFSTNLNDPVRPDDVLYVGESLF
jgi:polysaccharide export outer membrane protein